MSTKTDEVKQVLSDMGLTMESVFIPFSQSRNKAEKFPSLNWKVTIKKNDKAILTTDYMAGCGHCPGNNLPDIKAGSYEMRKILEAECEKGYSHYYGWSVSSPMGRPKDKILPSIKDVVYSLVMDSDVLEYDFADWCANFGYEEDSRKAEKIYNDCMQIALKMNRTLGTDGLNTLREVYQDY